MDNEKVYSMGFAKVFALLEAKVERKGRSLDELCAVTGWLTGYSREEIDAARASSISYGDFFRQAPAMNPKRELIWGKICGVSIEDISDPLMRDIRRLDKLCDELAKGRPLEKIMRS